MRCPVPYALLALLGWGAADAAVGRVGGWPGFRRLVALLRRARPAPVEKHLRYEEPQAYNKGT